MRVVYKTFMRLVVKTTGFSLTHALAAYVEQKFSTLPKLTARFAQRSIGEGGKHDPAIARVELGRTTRHHRRGDVYRAEITLQIVGGKSFRAEAEAGDIRSAIDMVRDEVLGELRRFKERSATAVRGGQRELKRRLRSIS